MSSIDPGVKFARSRIGNRQTDTLIGLAKGIISDGVVTQEEAEFLLTWLANNHYVDNIMVDDLLDRVAVMLSDGILDRDEQADLLQTLSDLVGNPGGTGELLRTSTLPLDDPQPRVWFPERLFLFTGTCAYGTRQRCQEFVTERGGLLAKSVTRLLDYLVVGDYVTKSWIHESYGLKIKDAMEMRQERGQPAIISEATLGFQV